MPSHPINFFMHELNPVPLAYYNAQGGEAIFNITPQPIDLASTKFGNMLLEIRSNGNPEHLNDNKEIVVLLTGQVNKKENVLYKLNYTTKKLELLVVPSWPKDISMCYVKGPWDVMICTTPSPAIVGVGEMTWVRKDMGDNARMFDAILSSSYKTQAAIKALEDRIEPLWHAPGMPGSINTESSFKNKAKSIDPEEDSQSLCSDL